MFLSKMYCFANEFEARSSFSILLSQVSADDIQRFDRALSAIFSVRRELFDIVNRSSADKRRLVEMGLPDICITANEDYVISALSAQGIGCYMELRQYNFNEIPAGLPRIHAYVIIKLGDSELVIDIDADPFYNENVGVVISPYKTDLYYLGSLVYKCWVTEFERIDKFECYTKDSRIYLTGEGIHYLTMRYYFLESDANECPIVLSPFSNAYFSYSAGWIGTTRHDWIKFILVSKSQEKDLLLWNLKFDNLSSIEIRFTDTKSLRLVFLDGTNILIPLDCYGYPLESSIFKYIANDAPNQIMMKYAFHCAPISRITFPSPFDEDCSLAK